MKEKKEKFSYPTQTYRLHPNTILELKKLKIQFGSWNMLFLELLKQYDTSRTDRTI